MHRIPERVEVALRAELGRRGVRGPDLGSDLKWCRFFIDFCLKTERSPRVSDSVAPFLAKLGSKGQGPSKQAQARKAVLILHEVLEEIPLRGGRVKAEKEGQSVGGKKGDGRKRKENSEGGKNLKAKSAQERVVKGVKGRWR